ncbi:SPOR domain-containing protein [Sphingosinicella sp. BN140058]|uniref:SPOR domain-containing protein n=1 Tax=Sphingosinicella sp. BN140058 TaxID=1892855 RepID=UPI0013EBA8A8|nr:SPOR domain-containing protein [Sphingosinicella sp. BN140058]
MNSSKVLKFGFAGLALAGTMVACNPGTKAFRPNSVSAQQSKSEQEALAAYAKANAASQQSDFAGALVHAERAVELSPQDVGFRMLLGDLYIKNGRFHSAETTFQDVLTLDPSNVRAGLWIALTRIAVGERAAAIAQLEDMPQAPAADLGLAYALAGETVKAVSLLEPAAREAGAAARVRQNLALAYALSGDWEKARTTAAQDIAPDQLSGRLQQWAALAKPNQPAAQVAAFVGVTPAADDAGQPARLALAPTADTGTALASAEQAEAAPVAAVYAQEAAPAAVEAPVQTADMSDWVSARDTQEATQPVYASAVDTLVGSQPEAIRAVAPAKQAARSFRASPAVLSRGGSARGAGGFAVQLGAFSSPAAVERAWASAYKRYGFSSQTPLSTTVKLPHGVFHRLSVAGFDSRGEAAQVCASVKAKGGVCFVRAVAGDAPVQWASRYTNIRRG